MTRTDRGDWPVFCRSEIGLRDVLAQLDDWISETVRVEVTHPSEAGYSSFYGRLAKVEQGSEAGQYLIHFEENAALIAVNVSALKTFRVTGTTCRTGWIEFESGERPIFEIGLEDPDEIWARIDIGTA